MNQRLTQCPVCNNTMTITTYHCSNCNTTISGKFMVGELDRLNLKQQEFVKVFLCCQGNIKEVEKVLNISYPTVKNRLHEVTTILCGEKSQNKPESEIILKEIENGKLSVQEAIKKLRR